jgi:hypothetical protein
LAVSWASRKTKRSSMTATNGRKLLAIAAGKSSVAGRAA